MPLGELIQRFLAALAAAGVETVLALWRILLTLLLGILLLLSRLLGLFERGEEPKSGDRCAELPPHVKRKPDPCLYSQAWLTSQGLAVTWNNPDIWVTDLGGATVPSDQLQPGTSYLVHARIHDSSFDPALATEIRCLYRPWSFNSPDRVPVETNPDGSERIVVVHIAPWSSEVGVFRWQTPAQGGHYCLQVECRHPDDKNPNNNLGQENTTVLATSAAAGMQIADTLDVFNAARVAQTFRVATDGYVVPRGEIELHLDSRERRLVQRKSLTPVRSVMLTRDPYKGVVSQARQGPTLVSHVYRGWDALRKSNARGMFELEPEWGVRVAGQPAAGRGIELEIPPASSRSVTIEASVPAGLAPGTYAMNVSAVSRSGRLIGGVTYEIEVQ